MLRGVAPTGKRDCDTTALERNAKLAQRFGLRGTPGVYLANGEQIGGYVPRKARSRARRRALSHACLSAR